MAQQLKYRVSMQDPRVGLLEIGRFYALGDAIGFANMRRDGDGYGRLYVVTNALGHTLHKAQQWGVTRG
jgi:hypothetical protein